MNEIKQGDSLAVLKTLPNESIDCIVTSPPYWALRDYDTPGQLGLEPTFQEYIAKLCEIFDEAHRVLKKTGTCWVNLGDTYYGGGRNRGGDFDTMSAKQMTNRGTRTVNAVTSFKWGKELPAKSLCQIPTRFAIAMTERGWILRNEIIWQKPNVMPQSVKDRFTVDFEKVFFFTKSKQYFFEQQFDEAAYDGRKQEKMRGSVKYSGQIVPGHAPHTFALRAHNRWQIKDGKRVRNKRSVWQVNNRSFKEAHFATFPPALIEPMIKAGCPKNGIVLDPFMGSGTTALVARRFERNYLGIELNPEYIKIAEKRLTFSL